MALCLQAATLVVGAPALDYGQMLRWAVLSIVVYWLSAGLILRHRPQDPTRWDLIYLRSGFVVIFAVIAVSVTHPTS